MRDRVDDIRSKVRALMPQARTDLATMVSFKSVFDPPGSPPPDCEKMVDWLMTTFREAGFVDVKANATSDGSKAVTGRKPGPAGAPTVLLYFHHDVQPVTNESDWTTPPWTLTEVDGRWYGRGSADCKGNIAVLLTALRALGNDLPVHVKIVGEGSEEQGTGGLEDFVPRNQELLAADSILVADAGNFAAGIPTLTTSLRGIANVAVTVKALEGPVHSGQFGGAAPDALAALIAMLGTLRDARGNTTIRGLDNTQTWSGHDYPADQFRADARVLPGVDLLGDGTVADMVWSRLTATVIGIDCPSVADAIPAVQAQAKALINVRVPPGMDAKVVQDAVIAHLKSVAPWNVNVTVEAEGFGQPFTAAEKGPAHDAMANAMTVAYNTNVVSVGQGGSIPLCNVFQSTFPKAEIMLLGVEEPKARIHAPNESVAPSEIENMAVALALFLQGLAPSRLPVPAEELWLDSRSGTPIRSEMKLEKGKRYRVTMQGTYSLWAGIAPPGAKSGPPEPAPMFPSPNGANKQVGVDPEFVFAWPKGSSLEHSPQPAPLRNSSIEISLDGGQTWKHPSNTAPFNATEHKYVYELMGDDNVLQVRLRDAPYSDNYGRVRIFLQS
jgi:acetylornithine deacetylase/succinyl-diaminopimelate desuccinylase-like protein